MIFWKTYLLLLGVILGAAAPSSARADTDPWKGIVDASVLRIRQSPGLEAPVVGALNRGDGVAVIGAGVVPMTIEGRTAPWHEVVGASGVRGWAFGGFIRRAPESPVDWDYAPDALKKKLEDSVIVSSDSVRMVFENGQSMHFNNRLSSGEEGCAEWHTPLIYMEAGMIALVRRKGCMGEVDSTETFLYRMSDGSFLPLGEPPSLSGDGERVVTIRRIVPCEEECLDKGEIYEEMRGEFRLASSWDIPQLDVYGYFWLDRKTLFLHGHRYAGPRHFLIREGRPEWAVSEVHGR